MVCQNKEKTTPLLELFRLFRATENHRGHSKECTRVPSPFHHPVYKSHRRSLAWSCSTATILSEDVSISLVWLGGYVKFEGLLLMLLHYVTMCTIKKIETLTQEVSHSQPTGSWQGKKTDRNSETLGTTVKVQQPFTQNIEFSRAG